jgi:hypothetical protein
MNNFITVDYLSTFVGMVAAVVLVTQFTKDLVDKISNGLPTKYITFIYSFIILIGYQLMTGTFVPKDFILLILNAILITMTAQGGYEWLYKPVEMKTSTNSIEPSQEGNTVLSGSTDPITNEPIKEVQSTEDTQSDTSIHE